jgi:hypothetical protein
VSPLPKDSNTPPEPEIVSPDLDELASMPDHVSVPPTNEPPITPEPPALNHRHSTFRQRLQAGNAVALRYQNTSFTHVDENQLTGKVDTHTASVVGAAVFQDPIKLDQDRCRLLVQSTDGSSRLLPVSTIAHVPATTISRVKHVFVTLWAPAATDPHSKLVPDELQELAMENFSDELHDAIQRHHVTTDEYSFESHPLTESIKLTTTTPTLLTASSTFASTLIDEPARPDAPTSAHEEPQDRAISAALLEIPVGLACPTHPPTSAKLSADRTGTFGRKRASRK